MSNWTEEYLWDRQEEEQKFYKALEKSEGVPFTSALQEYILSQIGK